MSLARVAKAAMRGGGGGRREGGEQEAAAAEVEEGEGDLRDGGGAKCVQPTCALAARFLIAHAPLSPANQRRAPAACSQW